MTKDESGDPLIRSTSSGSNFAIFFFGCTKNVDCRTIQLDTSKNGPFTV
jgi:hypothetical protein